jgi:hypothetical protein
MKSFKFVIAFGFFNLLHGGIHILQSVQSFLLTYFSLSGKNIEWIDRVMESPWMGLFWGLLGIATIWIGYRDYKHHKFHKD